MLGKGKEFWTPYRVVSLDTLHHTYVCFFLDAYSITILSHSLTLPSGCHIIMIFDCVFYWGPPDLGALLCQFMYEPGSAIEEVRRLLDNNGHWWNVINLFTGLISHFCGPIHRVCTSGFSCWLIMTKAYFSHIINIFML